MKRKILKWMLGTIGVILLLGALGLWIILRNLDHLVAEKISAALPGAEVTIGSTTVSFSQLQIENLKITSPQGSGQVNIQRVEAQWTWSGLWAHTLESLTISKPVLAVAVESSDLVKGVPSTGGASGKAATPFTVKVLKVTDGEIRLGKNPWGVRSDPIHVNLAGRHLETGTKFRLELDPAQCELRTATITVIQGKEEITARKVLVGFPQNGKPLVLDPKDFDLPLAVAADLVEARGTSFQNAKILARIQPDSLEATVTGCLFSPTCAVVATYKKVGQKQDIAAHLTRVPLSELAKLLPLKEAEGVTEVNFVSQLENRGSEKTLTGTLDLSSAGDWTFWAFGNHWDAPQFHVGFSFLLPKETWTKEAILAGLTLNGVTAQAKRFEYGGTVVIHQLDAKVSLQKSELTATLGGELAPTGKLHLQARAQLGPQPSIALTAELLEADLAKVAKEYTEGTLETVAKGTAALKVQARAEWDWEGERRPTWSASGELALLAAMVKIPSKKLEIEDLSAAIPFSLKSGDKELTLAHAAQMQLGKVRVDGEESVAGLQLTELSGVLPLKGENPLGRMRITAALAVDRLFAEGITATGVHCRQMVFEKEKLQIPELKCTQAQYGDNPTANNLSVQDLSVSGLGEMFQSDDLSGLKLVTASATASAEELHYGKIVLMSARSALALTNGMLNIKNFRATGNEAQFDLNLTLNIADVPSIEMRGTMKELNLHRWAPEKIETFDVDGPMEGDLAVKLTGKTWKALELESAQIQLASSARGGKLFFVDNDWIRALKTGQPELARLIFTANNSIEYDHAKIQLGRIGNDIVGEYAFRGKTVAPTFTITYHDMTFAKLAKRLQQLTQVKTGK